MTRRRLRVVTEADLPIRTVASPDVPTRDECARCRQPPIYAQGFCLACWHKCGDTKPCGHHRDLAGGVCAICVPEARR